MKIRYFCSCILALWVFTTVAYAQQLAFPGAEGYGQYAKGGRGGRVIEVTNLNDSGSGSLRAALTASGPRTVVFRVGGTINLTSGPLVVTQPYLTVAGQTAPGDGILVKGNFISIRASDTIIRYLRVRAGITGDDPLAPDALSLERNSSGPAVSNVMIDHCSLSWGEDETATVWGHGTYNVTDITYQWCIIGEGLDRTAVNSRTPSRGFMVGGGASRVTLHHSLIMSTHDRVPNVQSGDVDIINNFVYNPGGSGQLQPKDQAISINFENNWYEIGPQTVSTFRPTIQVRGDAIYGSTSGIYFNGNIHSRNRPTLSDAESNFYEFRYPDIPDATTPKIETTRFSSHPMPSMSDAFQAKADVMAKAGANMQVLADGTFKGGLWDAVDLRYFDEINSGKGSAPAITSPTEVGGYPTIKGGISPQDTDHDGMPDSWELAHGFNPENDSDGPQDSNGDGYTNLEEYLNGTPTVNVDVTPPNSPKGVNVS